MRDHTATPGTPEAGASCGRAHETQGWVQEGGGRVTGSGEAPPAGNEAPGVAWRVCGNRVSLCRAWRRPRLDLCCPALQVVPRAGQGTRMGEGRGLSPPLPLPHGGPTGWGRVGTHVGAGGHSRTLARLPVAGASAAISPTRTFSRADCTCTPRRALAGPSGNSRLPGRSPARRGPRHRGLLGCTPRLPPKPAHAHSPLLRVQPAQHPSTRAAGGGPLPPSNPPDQSLPGNCGRQRRPFAGRTSKVNGY